MRCNCECVLYLLFRSKILFLNCKFSIKFHYSLDAPRFQYSMMSLDTIRVLQFDAKHIIMVRNLRAQICSAPVLFSSALYFYFDSYISLRKFTSLNSTRLVRCIL